MWSVIFSHSDMVLSPLCIFYNLGKNKVANVFKHTSKGSNIRRMFVGGEKKKKKMPLGLGEVSPLEEWWWGEGGHGCWNER